MRDGYGSQQAELTYIYILDEFFFGDFQSFSKLKPIELSKFLVPKFFFVIFYTVCLVK